MLPVWFGHRTSPGENWILTTCKQLYLTLCLGTDYTV